MRAGAGPGPGAGTRICLTNFPSSGQSRGGEGGWRRCCNSGEGAITRRRDTFKIALQKIYFNFVELSHIFVVIWCQSNALIYPGNSCTCIKISWNNSLPAFIYNTLVAVVPTPQTPPSSCNKKTEEAPATRHVSLVHLGSLIPAA